MPKGHLPQISQMHDDWHRKLVTVTFGEPMYFDPEISSKEITALLKKRFLAM